MMSEIYRRGPITCGIATPADFTYGYHGGVYHDPKNYTRDSVDHDVEVVGWGEEAGQPVWIVRNSWGTFWGELGFFKLPRGINSLFIEDGDCWCADIHRCSCVLVLACMPILACPFPLPSPSFTAHPLPSSYNVAALQGIYLRPLCCSHILIKVSLKWVWPKAHARPRPKAHARPRPGHGWVPWQVLLGQCNRCRRQPPDQFRDMRRYADPEDEIEEEVLDGELLGSMFGLIDEQETRNSAADHAGLSRLTSGAVEVVRGTLQQLKSRVWNAWVGHLAGTGQNTAELLSAETGAHDSIVSRGVTGDDARRKEDEDDEDADDFDSSAADITGVFGGDNAKGNDALDGTQLQGSKYQGLRKLGKLWGWHQEGPTAGKPLDRSVFVLAVV